MARGEKTAHYRRSGKAAAWFFALGFFATGAGQATELPPGVHVDAVVKPEAIGPGQVTELAITIAIPAGWVVYDLEQTANSVQPTRITLDRSDDFSPLDGYQAPPALAARDPAFQNRIVRYFAQPPTFRRSLVFSVRSPPGRKLIVGHVDFQLHDPATGKYLLVRKASFETSVEMRAPSTGSTETETNAIPQVETRDTARIPAEPEPAAPGPEAEPAHLPAVLSPPLPTVTPQPAVPKEPERTEPEPSVARVVSVVEVRPGELDIPPGRSWEADGNAMRPPRAAGKVHSTLRSIGSVLVGIALGIAVAILRARGSRGANQRAKPVVMSVAAFVLALAFGVCFDARIGPILALVGCAAGQGAVQCVTMVRKRTGKVRARVRSIVPEHAHVSVEPRPR